MKINRRNLIMQAGIQIPAMIVNPSFSMADSPFKSFQLILSDVTASTPAEGLLAILDPFVKANIPISCIVSMESDADPLRPDSKLADYLRRFIADYPAQIEVILKSPTQIDRPYYFQSKLATQARRALEEGLLTAPLDGQLVRSLMTIANFGTSSVYKLGGVRAAGFRTVLTLPHSGSEPVDSRWDQGVLHLFGGMHFGLTEPFGSIKDGLVTSVRDDPRSLLILSVADLTPESLSADVMRMSKIASLISELVITGQIVPTNPTDYHVRAATEVSTVIGLRLDVTGRPDELQSASALELAQLLRANKFDFTVAGVDAHTWKKIGTGVCTFESKGDEGGQNPCRMLQGVKNSPQVNPPPRVAMVALPENDLIAGIDHLVTLHPPRFAFVGQGKTAAEVVSEIKLLEDTVLVLDQKSYFTAAQRQKAISIIKTLDQRSDFQVTDVASFADEILPHDSIRLVYHQTAEVMHREREKHGATELLDGKLIQSDAELAWLYFRKFSNSKTGLIPSTVFLTDGAITLYNYATMWDVASQILGMIAAVKLNLLPLPEFNSWAERLIENLPSVTIQGLRLPSSIFHVGNKEEPNQSFNTCDVGRLFVAFHKLRSFSPVLSDIIKRKVDSWDIQDTIHNGRMQDLSKRRSIDRFISHCTEYAARGYAHFNISADSPYSPLEDRDDVDSLFNLLYNASAIGSIGAEPLLLEGVELGFTAKSQYLADMLFSAQLEDNRKTGKMRCVSEGALNRAPWFTYQGYSIRNFADPWYVQVISTDAQYKRPDFLRSIELVSVKAAYLWAATHPHSYSHSLVHYVRSRARVEELGFSSGIYLNTGLPMADYSDLNTNGIILEAAAHILK